MNSWKLLLKIILITYEQSAPDSRLLVESQGRECVVHGAILSPNNERVKLFLLSSFTLTSANNPSRNSFPCLMMWLK